MENTFKRLDQLLVELGKYETRSRARDAILRGCIYVNGKVQKKPGGNTDANATISINDPAANYVSRAALKLVHGLEETGFVPTGKICLDIGASTGGFTQVLLNKNAARIFAIDVGHGQMSDVISNNPRVCNIEGLNARDLVASDIENKKPKFLVCDASFISLKLALPPALSLAADGASGIFLVKPQFEVGKDQIGKGGLVKDPEYAKKVASEMAEWLNQQPEWSATHFLASPIAGGDGNTEYLLAGQKNA